jgi:ABC-type sugar transport system substrate-binding protein
MNATSNILRQQPDLGGIYANNDGMALGVVEAVRSTSDLKKVAVIGTDGIREAKRSVGAGEMRATVAEFPFEEGQLGGTAIAFLLFLRGLAVLGSVRTAIVSTIEPFFTTLLGALVLSQPLPPSSLLGGALIALAVVLLQRKSE